MRNPVFISYKSEDRPLAEAIRARLHEWGYPTWMDVHDIPQDAYWPDAIDQALRESRAVIGLMTPAAVESRNVKNEWDWSIVNDKHLILMKMVDPCYVPMNYVSINRIDYFRDPAPALNRLRAALETPRGAATSDDSHGGDRYAPYLRALYERINRYLAEKIIPQLSDDPDAPEVIRLRAQRTPGVVDALFEKREALDPLFLLGGLDPAQAQSSGHFEELFAAYDGRALLLGEPGAGKTITLLHYARDAAVRRLNDPGQPLPILGIIPTWDVYRQPSIADWLASSYGAPVDASALIEAGDALMLLDGLDELGGQRPIDPDQPDGEHFDPRARFIDALRDLAQRSNVRVLITCRVGDYAEIGARIPLAGAITLRPLDSDQMRRYLRDQPELLAAVEGDTRLREMLETPLLLSFFAEAYRDLGSDAAALIHLARSPGDLRDRIFETFVHKRYQHEERKLQIRERSTAARLPFSLEAIYDRFGALALERSTDRAASENVFTIDHFIVTIPDAAERESLMRLAVLLNLMTVDDEGYYRFLHLRLHDFFAYRYALPLLDAPDKRVRARAARLLGQIGDPRALDSLIAALEDDSSMVRLRAAAALGSTRHESALAPLIRAATGDPNPDVRGRATFMLGNFRDDRSLMVLIHALGDDKAVVRFSACNALAQRRDPRAVSSLIARLGDTATFWDVTIGEVAAEALRAIGTPEALAALERRGT
jgi:hypothetical protein